MDVERLKKLAGSSQMGGKGTMRRKKKAVHKTNMNDDKRLQATLKRLGVSNIPGIEEVNIIKDDEVISFSNPKVQASITANTYVISGSSQTKPLSQVLPEIISQLGPDAIKQLAKSFPGMTGNELGDIVEEEEDDDDVAPDLVENFEEVANKG
eukprot:TRINITY_DN2383_c1_g2_i1.p2 TRINITY_DN2383_c1_g2~~TRINITY_DN2383_c1_g2_i1.p2  ORF type:complete len:173 (-),score=43.44 TRINITY_DN2383_c1_g2_i1:176-634(-)